MPRELLAAPNLSPADCDLQHARFRDDKFERHGILATPGMDLSSACARALGRADWRLFNKALFHAATFATNYASQRRVDHDGAPLPDGVFMPDMALPGSVFLVFANADARGFGFGGLLRIDEIALLFTTSSEPLLRIRKLEIVNAIRASARAGLKDVAALTPLVADLAAMLLGDDEIERIGEIADALPAVVLLTRVAADRRSVHAKAITTTLPGQWLGTRAAAGRS